MARENNRTMENRQHQIVEQLDLHGFRESAAIAALTTCLDRVCRKYQGTNSSSSTMERELWVLIVTGSGAHSPNGPVLRSAVQRYLERRQMLFTLNQGKGSFTVNANSGVVFYDPGMPTCTKVIVQDSPVVANASCLAWSTATAKNKQSTKRDNHHLKRTFRSQQTEERHTNNAITQSLREDNRIQREETSSLQRVLSLSALEAANHQPLLDENDDEQLQLALEESKQQQTTTSLPDVLDDELRLALELSTKVRHSDEEQLQYALECSVMDHDDVRLSSNEEQDASLRQALKLSMEHNGESGA